ncbi:DUF2721 domain-containing protein [Methanofollis formosanus]|uniref:DUF2721 domain-containing protein n=1 Tax=Methanofollis formosanus TaxID=299308 RepID=A0A8G1EFK8_9EURY|nr:DUF2721 domain-containing protein [Methanofollis formosanus]QYZ78868.1 DUF2721 domain-containing protein [Methanofollis formosanus]
MTSADIIQTMLAPGLMISACGLLLLGMSNKYSVVLNRIRVLDEEKRVSLHDDPGRQGGEDPRFACVLAQLSELQIRARFERDAIVCYSGAVAFFVLTSLFIGFSVLGGIEVLGLLTIASFLVGMLLVLAGVLLAGWEAVKGYRIICLDMQDN